MIACATTYRRNMPDGGRGIALSSAREGKIKKWRFGDWDVEKGKAGKEKKEKEKKKNFEIQKGK